jgi:outer membrane lipoprotein-sorting protein
MKTAYSAGISALLLLIFFLAASPCFGREDRDLEDLIRRSMAAFDQVKDYRCTFHKKELVRGKLRSDRNITFKFRKPASFYLGYNEGDNKGREAIYVEGKFDGKLKVHQGGFFGFVNLTLDPRGSLAMRDNRHPITEAGIGHVIQLVEKNYRMAKNDPDSRIELELDVPVNGKKVILIKSVLPKGRGYYGHKVVIAVDQSLLLPVKATVFGWNDELLEEYEYDELQLNVGLTDRDFDTDNPEYHF